MAKNFWDNLIGLSPAKNDSLLYRPSRSPPPNAISFSAVGYADQSSVYWRNKVPARPVQRWFGASIKIGPGKMGKDILNKTGKGGILDIVTGCPGSDKTREEVIERWASKEK